MSTLTCRLLPLQARTGPGNMAADEVMLQGADQGIASLRFYTWNEATLSLGYFQSAAVRLADPRLAGLPWVRRPSGGAAILHHHELTYCLALPAEYSRQRQDNWICRFHQVIATALQSFGVLSQTVACGEERKLGDFLCFLHQTPGDLRIASSKIGGSAQRKRCGALMQHGSILLEQSTHTPALPGIAELSGMHITASELAARIMAILPAEFGWLFQPDEFSRPENAEIERLAHEKYASS